MKEMLFSVSKVEDTTTIKFFEEGKTIAILEQNELIEETVFNITVSAGHERGRLLCRIDNGVNFTAHENLSLVLHWMKKCKNHLKVDV